MTEPRFMYQGVYDADPKPGYPYRRESYVLATERGAVEAWRSPSPLFGMRGLVGDEYYGGIEIHLATTAEGYTHMEDCRLTRTGECWTSGSSMAFDQVRDIFDNPDAVRDALARWARGRILFGGEPQ